MDFYNMFLKLLEPILTALQKNVKLALLAILLSVLITWNLKSESKLKDSQDDCDESRKIDQETILYQAEELKDIRKRLFDAFMQQQVQRENTQINDSLMRAKTQGALNMIQK